MKEISVLFKSLGDFFTGSMLKIALLPFVVMIVFLYMAFFYSAGIGVESISEVSTVYLNNHTVIDQNAPIYNQWFTTFVTFLIKYSITTWVAGFLIYFLGTILIFQISLIFSLIIIGFFTPHILGILHKRYYSHLKLEPFGTIFSSLWVLFKSLFMMILIFLILMPLYFIPLLNTVAFLFPFYYFFHKLLNFDVSSTILSKDEYEKIYKNEKGSFRLRTLFLYLFSMIPFVSLFASVYFVIYLGHSYFIKLDELRKVDIN